MTFRRIDRIAHARIDEDIRSCPAPEHVVSCAAEDHVGSPPAINCVDTPATRQKIMAGTAVDCVFTLTARDHIGS